MLLTFKNLGIPTAPHNTQGPSTTLEFMGIVLDSDRMEARLPKIRIRSNVSLPVSLNLKAAGPAHSRNYSLLLAL